ncbi:MAG: xylan 1,4-beta-xylosidase [Anaerotignum sp.]|jgi:hypothetical protein|nr:xylan 1,4-beta-xylosidase [Anaerotignum sp.]
MAKYNGEKVDDRFEKIYTQKMGTVEILLDKETGVQYLICVNGYGGGVTPLLDKDGKPAIYDPYQF